MTASALSGAAQPLPLESLGLYLEKHLPGFQALRSATKFNSGQSNPTYLLEARSGRYVLRRKPHGALLASAHAVDREYRVISALAATNVPVPKALLLCTDDSVIGSMFYVMEFLDGRTLWDHALPDFSMEQRSRIYEELNRVLAALHSVDIAAVGLTDYGRAGNYYSRQISRWVRQYRASETGNSHSMEKLISWLEGNVPPEDGRRCLVHGDYRLDNVMFHRHEKRAIAVLDWELSTLGHPFADLAYQCAQWRFPHDAELMPGLGGVDRRALGIPTEEEYVAMYCRRTGVDNIHHWNFYLAISYFRLAAICQGVYKRGLDGNASSTLATQYGDLAEYIARTACGLFD
jgi:aminoglycoside phosphotransferase (APT) family kinase protein